MALNENKAQLEEYKALLILLNEKNTLIATRRKQFRICALKAKRLNESIKKQREEIEQLVAAKNSNVVQDVYEVAPLDSLGMNEAVVANIIGTATHAILKTIETPVRNRAIIPFPPQSQVVPLLLQQVVLMDPQETEDSLSFLTFHRSL